MTDASFTIGADGIDTAAVMEDIRKRVDEKRASGVYADSRIAMAERHNLANLKTEEEFLEFYMQCLREAVFIDINDFTITERRAGPASTLLVSLKKVIWKLLKFYTYRMWSQQNQVNSLLQQAIEGMDDLYRERISELEARIAELEGGRPDPS